MELVLQLQKMNNFLSFSEMSRPHKIKSELAGHCINNNLILSYWCLFILAEAKHKNPGQTGRREPKTGKIK